MAPHIRLLSTDFDGTVVSHGDGLGFPKALAQQIAELRAGGAVWAINTGRTLAMALEGIETFEITEGPDYLLTCEREVYRRAGTGWEDYGDWNAHCARAHASHFLQCNTLLEAAAEYAEETQWATPIREHGTVAGFIAAGEPEMDRLVDFLRELGKAEPNFGFQRNSIYLRFCHANYHKGAALSELARLLEIPPSQIFAAGDHFNDLSMLDGIHADMVACPANAVKEVKIAVRAANGYVAQGHAGNGVSEALAHFRV